MSPTRKAWLFLFVGLVAASQSGNLQRLGDANATAIVAWRLSMAAVLMSLVAGRRMASLARLTGRQWLMLVLAALALAGHLVTWTAAVQHTTIANAAIFFSINPVLTAIAEYVFFHEQPTRHLVASIALGVAGVLVLAAGDLTFSTDQIDGDALAVLCSVLFSVYFLVGKPVRQVLPSPVYVAALYGIAGLAGMTALAVLGVSPVDFGPRTWMTFVLLALIPTMIGHTSFNHALRYMSAGVISTATLSEPLMAGVVAAAAWGEGISPQAIAGYLLMCGSVAVLVVERQPGARIAAAALPKE